MISVSLPLRTFSEANRRDHWRVVRRRHAEHASVVHMRLAAELSRLRAAAAIKSATQIVVTLTRVASRRLDTDNLPGSFKGVVDGVARALAIDDGDPRMAWRFEQRQDQRYMVEIRVEPSGAEAVA